MTIKTPNPIDVYVGNKIREARIRHGLSQSALAEMIGITFQQLQKYENAHNRVSCSRLYAISLVLDIPVQTFFAGTESDEGGAAEQNVLPQPNTLDLVNAYSRLSPALRKSLSKTAKSLANITGETP
jgi:transcriptional regulator with XRE-family HTH domain